MRKARFRLALVGAGMVTQGSHLPAALASERIEVAAIVDPETDRAEEVARYAGISPRIAARVEDVLDIIDGAIIATPNFTHKDIALACLSARISVLVEKPLATTVADGEAILAAARKSGAVVAVGYYLRFWRNMVLLKQLLAEDYFGRALRFAHQFGTAGGWAPFSGYNLDRTATGGGVLVVSGTHFLDRLLWFWGVPDEVELFDDAAGGSEANCVAYFRYRSSPHQLTGIACYSKTHRLPGGLVVETTEGTIVAEESEGGAVIFRPHRDPGLELLVRGRDTHRGRAQKGSFQLQLENFVEACRGGRPPEVPGEVGLQSLRLIETLYRGRRPLECAQMRSVER